MDCFKCLGAFHSINECGPCLKLGTSARARRTKAMNIYLDTGSWPKNLDSVDSSSYKGKVKTKKSLKVVEEEVSMGTSTPHGEEANTLLETDLGPDAGNEDLHDTETPDTDELQGAVGPEPNTEEIVIVGESGPNVNKIETDEETFKEFQDYIKKQALLKALKRKGHEEVEPPSKNPKIDLTKDPVITNLQTQVSSVDVKLNMLLERFPAPPPGQTPLLPPPSHPVDKSKGAIPKIPKIPKKKPIETVSTSLKVEELQGEEEDLVTHVEGKPDEIEVEYRGDEGEGDEEEEEDIDPYDDIDPHSVSENLSKRASRNIWLSALPEVCPDLPQVKPLKSSGKNKFFKSVKEKKTYPLMPFIPEVTDICMELSSVKSKTSNLQQIEKFYETEQEFEKQLLGCRSVPAALSKEVPPRHIKTSGASEYNARLNPKDKFGTQEKMSLESSRFAGAYLRLSNNFQLALTSLEAQLEQCKLKADLIGSKSFESQKDKSMVQNDMEDLIHKFNVMSLAIKDMGNTNGDLLQAASYQYGFAAKSRAAAWVEASSLPKDIKKQMLQCDPQPPVAESTVPLKVVSPEAETILTNYTSERKERTERAVLVKSLRINQGQNQRGKQRGNKQGKQRNRNFNASQYQQFQEFTRAQTSWNNRGRGSQRGQNTRGRGGNQRGRGRGGPFPASQNKQGQ